MSSITNNLREKIDITNLPNPVLFDDNLVTERFMEMLPPATQLSFLRAIGKSSLKAEDFAKDRKVWNKRIRCCNVRYDNMVKEIIEEGLFSKICKSGDHVLLDQYLHDCDAQGNYKNNLQEEDLYYGSLFLARSEHLESFAVLINSVRMDFNNCNHYLLRSASAKVFSFCMRVPVDIGDRNLATTLFSDLRPMVEAKKIIDMALSSSEANKWKQGNLYSAVIQGLCYMSGNPFLDEYLYKKVDEKIDLFVPTISEFFKEGDFNLPFVLRSAIGYERFKLTKVLIDSANFRNISPRDLQDLLDICRFKGLDDLAEQIEDNRYQ